MKDDCSHPCPLQHMHTQAPLPCIPGPLTRVVPDCSPRQAKATTPQPHQQVVCTTFLLHAPLHTQFSLSDPRAVHRCRCNKNSGSSVGAERGGIKKKVAWSLVQSRYSTKVSSFSHFSESKTKVHCGLLACFSHLLWQM